MKCCVVTVFFLLGVAQGRQAKEQYTLGSWLEGLGLAKEQKALDSCEGRCDTPVDRDAECQCNSACERFGDCCDDYASLCKGQPSDTELKAIAETLWSVDDNRASSSDYTIDTSGPKFFSYFNEDLFNKPTWNHYRKIINNYVPEIGTAEPPCGQCRNDEDAFLSAAMETRVMQRAWEWLSDRGLASTSENGFKQELKQYWFQVYSRSQGPLDSSGFEHVFAGEVRSNGVTGFHGWQRYYLEEDSGELEHGSTLHTCTAGVYRLSFTWLGYSKPISSIWTGPSPELELALYTICFQSRRNRACNVTINGKNLKITNYDMSNVTPKTVGTAYVDC